MLKVHTAHIPVPVPSCAKPDIKVRNTKRVSGGERPSVLLVEHRGEVYARLAADLEEAGYSVQRASNVEEATRQYTRSSYDLLIVNSNLPDASGWLLAAMLQLVYHKIRIWLYTPNMSNEEFAQEELVPIDRLIRYGGDLWRLSAQITRTATV